MTKKLLFKRKMAKNQNKKKINIKIALVSSLTIVVLIATFLLPKIVLGQDENLNVNTNLNANSNINSDLNQNTNTNVADQSRGVDGSNLDLSQLNAEINAKKSQIDDLQKQADAYQKNVAAKQKEAASLQGQLSIIDNEIAVTDLEIQSTATQIDKIILEIDQTQRKIDEKKASIENQKDSLSEFIRLIDKNENKSYLELILLNNSFSDFFNEIKYSRDLESQVKKDLDRIVALKHDLEIQQEDLNGKKTDLDLAKKNNEEKKLALSDQKDYKSILLEQTKTSQDQFEELLADVKQQQNQVNSEIVSLDNRMREKMSQAGGQGLIELGNAVLSWPINPTMGISAYFHDPEYPFRNIFAHPAIDIPASAGTPIGAADAGFVAIARKLDWTTRILKSGKEIKIPAYNYVSIIHGGGISTVYGHLSTIAVSEGDFVTKGQIIGTSGGIPGTAGAGLLTTGAHLHFEVRVDGIPDDPLKYLP